MSRSNFKTHRAGLYIGLIVFSAVGAWGLKLRTQGLFACPADLYSDENYLAYCNSTAYGDYDHGAFWFATEPQTRAAASDADVIFLGNSRLQFGFSTHATDAFFREAGADYYLLGFSHFGNVNFAAPLLADIQPRARVYVINADSFFDTRLSPPAAEILSGSSSESRYRYKRGWQYPHREICGAIPRICGSALAFFRDRPTGKWQLGGKSQLTAVTVNHMSIDHDVLADHAPAIGRDFASKMPIAPNCMLLTVVPSRDTPSRQAQALALELGVPLIAPFEPTLRTFDGSHLDRESAERWSAAFFSAAGPAIHRCLEVTSSASR